jgi:hypothetical protein
LCPSIHSMSMPAPVERWTFTDLGVGPEGGGMELVSHRGGEVNLAASFAPA